MRGVIALIPRLFRRAACERPGRSDGAVSAAPTQGAAGEPAKHQPDRESPEGGPMSYSVGQGRGTKQLTGWHLVIEDYTKKHDLCRHRIWVGLEEDFSETVTFAFEHGNANLYIGWAINGTTVVDPGLGNGTPPQGLPCPGAPSVTFH